MAMILLIKCDKEPKSFNNWATSFNQEMSDIDDIFLDCGYTTLLLYKRTLPSEWKNSLKSKRGIKSLLDLDLSLLTQDCIIFFHADVFNRESDIKKLVELFEFCHNNNKSLIIQYGSEDQEIIEGIKTGSEVYIDRKDFSNYLKNVERELKIGKLLG